MTQLKTQCESLLEKHEEDIEDWYFEKQDEVESTLLSKTSLPWIKFQVSFEEYVCRERALKKGEDSCLGEKLQKLKKKKKSKKEKGETGSKTELWWFCLKAVLYSPFPSNTHSLPASTYLLKRCEFQTESGWRWAGGWGSSMPQASRPTQSWWSRGEWTSSCF